MSDAVAFRDFERQAQDRGAASYVHFFEPVTAAITDDLLDAAGVGAGVRLLDVASGPGATAARATARGAEAVGVDLSTQMVAQARSRHPHIEFREADAEALPFVDGSFDAITCSFGIGHSPNPDVAAREFCRVLRSGGRMAVSWWNLPHGAKVNGNFFDAMAEAQIKPPADLPVGPPITRYSDRATLLALLADGGLTGIAVRELTWTVAMSDTDRWWRGGLDTLVRAAVTILAQPPEEQQRVRKMALRGSEWVKRGPRG
jgi:SAM-dependent methyltransferase